MLKNHLKSILRNLKRNRAYAVLNITGLSIGFAAAVLIAVYVKQEFTFDQHYQGHERVYRLSARSFAFSSIAHLSLLESKVAGVEATVNIMPNPSGTLKYEEASFIEKSIFYATEGYLDIFKHKFLYGNPETAFDRPDALIITASMAKKIFGKENPLGKPIRVSTQISSDNYQVTGVVEDLPYNTTLRFEAMVRTPADFKKRMANSFTFTTGYSYFKMASAIPAAEIQEQTDRIYAQRMHEQFGGDQDFESYLEEKRSQQPWVLPLADVHLDSDLQFEASTPGSRQYLFIFIGIAVFIILLAAINYINLATAQASRKAKEVGVRKVLGSYRGQLISRFLTESVLLTFLSVLFGLGLAEGALQLMKSSGLLTFNVNVFDFPELIGLILLVASTTGVLAGIYPAFYLTRFRPSAVLKGDYKAGEKSKWFRNSLVVFQFVVSLTLAVFSVFIYQQLQYSLDKDLGFNKENVIVINNSQSQLGDSAAAIAPFKNELLKNPAVLDVSMSHFSMIYTLPMGGMQEITGDQEYWNMQYKYTDDRFIPTMGLKIKEGRNFDPELDGDRTAMVVNEAFAKMLGGEVLGRRFNANFNGRDVKIVGIVEDFHYEDMTRKIGPTTFFYREYPNQISVRVESSNLRSTLSEIQSTYASFTDEPLDYYFFDQQFDQFFESEKRLGEVITIFTSLSVLVALLGLIGLISYQLDQRLKEIGIRKVLGASVAQILALISKDMTRLVTVAIVITVPLGVYVTSQWLNNFAYHVDLAWLPFVLVALGGMGITLLIVSLRTVRTARLNPATTLRNE